jgi:two-component system sensor histidine kinase ChvG
VSSRDLWRRLRAWRPSRIGLRLLAFNLLLVFLPVFGILYLDVYETRLLAVQERGMVQQARLVAAALGDRAPLPADEAVQLLSRFGQRGDARVRVYDATAAPVADSVRLPEGQVEGPQDEALSEYTPPKSVRQRLTYRIGAWLMRARRKIGDISRDVVLSSRRTPGTAAEAPRDAGPGAEVRAALAGRYGTAIRPTPGQRSLTLYVAVPIRHGDRVVGAVVVSQSTLRILQALYDVRLRIFQIVIASIAAALALGVVASATIVRPLVRLRRAAMALSDRRATPSGFRHVDRKDEIGDLARSLEELTARLDAHIRLLESFTGDVAHELKNPLASIRVAAETMAASDDERERERLLAMLTRDADRLDRLVSGVRELARIDAQLAQEHVEPFDLTAFVRLLVEGVQQRVPRVSFVFRAEGTAATVRASADRLAQVVENLLDNAASLAPAGSTVDVVVSRNGSHGVVRVEDRGPGIPAGHLDRVFDRFFSYRPDSEGRDHMGLGLSIVRAIVEGYGGAASASNRPGGGASFQVRLPALAGAHTDRPASTGQTRG